MDAPSPRQQGYNAHATQGGSSVSTTASALPPAVPLPPAPPRPPMCSKEANRYKSPASGEQDNTAYRRVEKQYRRQRLAVNRRRTRFVREDPDLADAVDFAREGVEDDPRVRFVTVKEDGRRIYALRDRPGFYYVLGALDWRKQVYWARCCLREFSRSPYTNITNNHAEMNDASDHNKEISSSSSLWERAVLKVEKGEGGGEGELSQAVQDLHALRWANIGLNYLWTTRQYAASANKDEVKDEDGEHNEEGLSVEEEGQEEQDGREEGRGVQMHDTSKNEDSLPFASTSHYQRQNFFPIPPALTELAQNILALVALADSHDLKGNEGTLLAAPPPPPPPSEAFQAEAGIVNYYPPESSMGGHVDDAEGALEVPLVSFSLGLGGVFLLGGRSKEVEPVPIVFRSGDCMVMGGEARLYFHGVPCVLMESARPDERLVNWKKLSSVVGGGEGGRGERQNCTEAEDRLLAHYLASSRVNFNVRQVWRRRGWEGRTPATTAAVVAAAAHQQ
eukprot:evm.model.NODE_18839_length_45268_cov_23.220222.6